jgi:hypothetical protein
VGEVVKEGKKYIKTAPFETVDPDSISPSTQPSSLATRTSISTYTTNTS